MRHALASNASAVPSTVPQATGAAGSQPATGDAAWPTGPRGEPDFAQMNSAQRIQYDRFRLTRKFG